MDIDIANLKASIEKAIENLPFVDGDSIPNIALYMDQVTTFMDKYLKGTTRYPDSDKILTKTMINNYAKNDLLPPPDRKKYSKEHILVLLFIYYFKNTLSMSDIQNLLGPLTEDHFHTSRNVSIEKIYSEITNAEKSQQDYIKEDLSHKLDAVDATMQSLDEKDDFLELFTLLSLLNHDIWIKKQIMEKALDDYFKKHPVYEAPPRPKPKAKPKKRKTK